MCNFFSIKITNCSYEIYPIKSHDLFTQAAKILHSHNRPDYLFTQNTKLHVCQLTKCGWQPIQDQSSVLGADILKDTRNNYYGRSSKYPQHIQLSPKHQSSEFRCSCEVTLCKSVILVVNVHVCKQWPVKRHVSHSNSVGGWTKIYEGVFFFLCVFVFCEFL